MKKNYAFGLLVLFVLFVSSACTDYDDYPNVAESLTIINQTDTSIIVEYGFEQADSALMKKFIYSNSNDYMCIDKSTTNNSRLWINEAEFNALTRTLKIYRVENNDTSFVNPNYYDKMDLWSSNMYKDYDFGVYISISHAFEVKPEMFQQ